MANAKLKFFTQILLAIMFTTNSYVKYREIAFIHFDKDRPYRIFLNFAYL